MEHTRAARVLATLARLVCKKWRLLLQMAGVTLLFVLLTGVSPFRSSPRRQEEADPPARPGIRFEGIVQGQAARAVGSRFDGTVETIAVREGQRVSRGQPLFRMDACPLRAALAGVQAELEAAQAELRQARAERAEELRGPEQKVEVSLRDPSPPPAGGEP